MWLCLHFLFGSRCAVSVLAQRQAFVNGYEFVFRETHASEFLEEVNLRVCFCARYLPFCIVVIVPILCSDRKSPRVSIIPFALRKGLKLKNSA
jgi:hypothetical protein